MTSFAAERLRKLADEIENKDLDLAVKRLTTLSIPFPNLAEPQCGTCGLNPIDHEPGGQMYGDHDFAEGPPVGTPFFTEAYLYDLFGKDDARSILMAIRMVLVAAGVAAKDIP